MKDIIDTRFKFEYENDSTASYLVLTMASDEDILEYQMEMIDNNNCLGILDLDARYKNDEVKLYYNITSKLVLSQFLQRKKLSKMEFIDILRGITYVLLESREYFLYDKSFLIHEDYIYIDPSTLEIGMVYLPIEFEKDINQSFKDFLVNLIISLAKIDEKSSGNYIQRILNYIKKDIFSIYDFHKMLNEIRKNEFTVMSKEQNIQQCNSQDSNIKDYFNNKDICLKHDYQGKNEKGHILQKELNIIGSLKNNDDQLSKNTVKKRYKPKYIFIAVLTQVLIIVALIFSLDSIKSLAGGGFSTYGGITLIVAAVDVMLFRYLFKKENMEEVEIIKNINMSKKEIINSKELNYCDKEYEAAAVDCNMIEDKSLSINETVVLDEQEEELPYLQRINNGIIEKVSITKSNFIIGRLGNYVDYLIENNVIGRTHAEILCREKQYFIRDLNSKNGTFLNRVRLKSNVEYKIDNGDNIEFANIKYTFINEL